MTIASELSDAQTNLANAKNAVTAKGGTVGNTGLAGLASEIASIPSGGGTTIPSTWAEFKAMTATQLKAIWPVGHIVDIPCTILTFENFTWKVAEYGTCKLENDNTSYPCVTLISQYGIGGLRVDARERQFASQNIEPTAVAGTFYYGVTSASGTPTASNTTKLTLSPGDPIPYSDYGRIYKNSVETDGAGVNNLYSGGYNNYPLSNIRQYLNATTSSNWYQSSHPGDSAPNYSNQPGFQTQVSSDFLAVVSPTATKCVLNNATDGGTTVTIYDKFFLPSASELQFSTMPDEGDGFPIIKQPSDRVFARKIDQATMPSNDSAYDVATRTVYSSTIHNIVNAGSSGTPLSGTSYSSYGAILCCRIILAGA